MNLQQGEPGKLEGPDGDLADAVAAQPQDLQGGAQLVQTAQLQHADLVVVQVPEHRSRVINTQLGLERSVNLRPLPPLHSQVLDPEAGGKTGSSEFRDVIVAQIQSFHGHQLCHPAAIDGADLIVMSEEEEEKHGKVKPALL